MNSIDPPALDERAKYGLAGEIVEQLSPYTEAAEAGVLFTLLAGFGAMLGTEPYMQAGSRQAARLWPLLVGPTGTGRKGTSWTTASMPLWFADRGAFLNRCVSPGGLSTGEGLVSMVRDGEEPDNTKRRSQIDEGVADKRKLIVEPEFARTLAASRRDNNTLSGVLREAWEGSDLSILTRSKPLRASRPHIVLIAHCTPSELKSKLSDSDIAGGLVNRFLIVAVRRSKLLPSGERPPDDLLTSLGGQLRERFTAAKNGPRRLKRDDDAERLWEKLYTDVLNPDHDDEGPFAQAVTRGAAYVGRLSLIYAVLDGAHNIRQVHVAAAAAAWDYCYSSAQMLFGGNKRNDDLAQAQAYIRACGPDGATRSALSRLFRRAKSSAELDSLTTELVGSGNVVLGAVPDRSKHPVLVWVGVEQFSQFADARERSRSP